ncbi:MAG: 30S ribosomal protein S6 [Desulfosudaceae bacterium]
MRRYETVFIADPDLAPDAQKTLFDKARALIDNNAGQLVDFDEWGNRRLAYEIRKKQRGHYVRLDYCGSGETVSQLEGAFRIDERVLKFMTIFMEEDADPVQLQEAIAAAKPPAESETPAAGQKSEPAAEADNAAAAAPAEEAESEADKAETPAETPAESPAEAPAESPAEPADEPDESK